MAPSTGSVSISRSAASHKAWDPIVLACELVPSLEHHVGRGPPRTQAARLKPASHAGNIPGNSDPKPMTILTLPDLAAFVWFVGAWIVYPIVIERSAKGRTALNALMNSYRDEWMERLRKYLTPGAATTQES